MQRASFFWFSSLDGQQYGNAWKTAEHATTAADTPAGESMAFGNMTDHQAHRETQRVLVRGRMRCRPPRLFIPDMSERGGVCVCGRRRLRDAQAAADPLAHFHR
jgi:hypothetical protein